MGQTFHWLFLYAIKYSFPKILKSTDNWGAFFLFAGLCFLGILYVFFMVPEVSGLSVEEIETLFQGPWFEAYKKTARQPAAEVPYGTDEEKATA